MLTLHELNTIITQAKFFSVHDWGRVLPDDSLEL